MCDRPRGVEISPEKWNLLILSPLWFITKMIRNIRTDSKLLVNLVHKGDGKFFIFKLRHSVRAVSFYTALVLYVPLLKKIKKKKKILEKILVERRERWNRRKRLYRFDMFYLFAITLYNLPSSSNLPPQKKPKNQKKSSPFPIISFYPIIIILRYSIWQVCLLFTSFIFGSGGL